MREKILIVEDNAELLDLLRSHLKAAGFAVATATNGIEALKKVRSVSPDLVLLDLVLPELDGFAVYETLRRSPATASVPVLIVTGLSCGPVGRAGLDKGACEVITKPVNPRHLIARIREVLRSERGPSGAPNGEKSKLPERGARMPARGTDRGSGLEVESRYRPGQVSTPKRR